MAASFMESEHWLAAGWTMLHFLWVGGAIGLLAGAGRLVLGSARPHVRYLFALGCLAALTAAPAAIALLVMRDGVSHAAGTGLAAAAWPRDPSAAAVFPAADLPLVHPPHSAPGAASAWLWRAKAVFSASARYLPWVWVTGAPLVFLMVVTGLAGAERLGRQSRLLDQGSVPPMCQRLRVSLKIARRVAVGICDRVTCPVLIGILRPVILLPPAALMGWSTDQLEMVLLHELAHVRRWDNLVNLLQRIVESILFFHPVVWLVSGWVRSEREHCCDQAVLAYTQRPRAYAELLASMVAPDPGRLALVAMGEANVVTRIRRVLRLQNETMRWSHKVIGLLTCVFLATVILAGAAVRSSSASLKSQAVSRTWALAPGISSLAQTQPAPARRYGMSGTPVRARYGTSSTRPTPARRYGTRASALAPLRGSSESTAQETVTLLAIGPDGKPVEGANIALRAQWRDGQPRFFCRRPEPQDLTTGEDGRAALPWVWFAQQEDAPAGLPVLVMDVGRELSGIVVVPPPARGQELTVRLQRSCRVRFRLDSAVLRQQGDPLLQVKGHILLKAYPVIPLFEQIQEQSPAIDAPYEFEYLLPPGQYVTWFFGDADGRPETEHVRIAFEVKEGQEQLDLGLIDLPPTRYSLFYDQPAPELVGVREVRTNTPIKLSDFRGKVLILCFAPSYNCSMTLLREFAETYKQYGIQVVVIHNSLAGFPAEGRSRYGGTQAGADRADPAWIDAVDAGGMTRVEGTSREVQGATAAAYGLETNNIVFLIDREGQLVQRFRLDRPNARIVLENALGLIPGMNRRPELKDWQRR